MLSLLTACMPLAVLPCSAQLTDMVYSVPQVARDAVLAYSLYAYWLYQML